ncbi:MAG: hypothetical protein P1V51_19720 [Deltaproteobacteria bacterium]|nr:hypothetical protein [Deltaproteobacteria bacterium]
MRDLLAGMRSSEIRKLDHLGDDQAVALSDILDPDDGTFYVIIEPVPQETNDAKRHRT